MSEQQNGNQSIDRPLDRLNYYNGQRLEAHDLRLEQQYHMRMRRWLNKSLYPGGGVVDGLEVSIVESSLEVAISPGLALDTQGREIILLDRMTLPCPPNPDNTYLTIRYNDYTTAYEDDDCAPNCDDEFDYVGSKPAWGGPALIRAEPEFAWRSHWPLPDSGEVLLAQVILTEQCDAVQALDLSQRTKVEASGKKVYQYALEGSRDIDANNPTRIYFHIRGRQPTSVTLYLRACRFPSHYYKFAEHRHELAGGISIDDHDEWQHSHDLEQSVDKYFGVPRNSVEVRRSGAHEHRIWMLVQFVEGEGTETPNWGGDFANSLPTAIVTREYSPPIEVVGPGESLTSGPSQIIAPGNARVMLTPQGHPFLAATGETVTWDGTTFSVETEDGGHDHNLNLYRTGKAVTNDDNPVEVPDLKHTYSSEGLEVTSAGSSPHPVYPEPDVRHPHQLAYVKDLQISISNHGRPAENKTTEIVQQLRERDSANWPRNAELGDGTASHALVEHGTDEIKLNMLRGLTFTEGEHYIELKVEGAGNGGRIVYNLYVE